MNERTLVAICGYAGDAHIAEFMRHIHERHACPILVLSPKDSPIKKFGPHLCVQAGKRAYIGQPSLDRQIEYFRACLKHDFNFFLLNDADSCVLSPVLPAEWYRDSVDTLWTNVVVDPRTHSTNLPRLAFQPPYFMSRATMEKMVEVSPRCPANPITPYVDHFMLQLAIEAGIKHRHFGELEKEAVMPSPTGNNAWLHTAFRIQHKGCVTQHPVKTFLQVRLIEQAAKEYERTQS